MSRISTRSTRRRVGPLWALALAISSTGCVGSNDQQTEAVVRATVPAESEVPPGTTTSLSPEVEAVVTSTAPVGTAQPEALPWLQVNQGDSSYPSTALGFIEEAEYIVVVEVESVPTYLAVADAAVRDGKTPELIDASDALFAVYSQSLRVVEVFREQEKVSDSVNLLIVGPNVRNEIVRTALELGRAQLSDNGLGGLPTGRYVLFLKPSGSSAVESVDFSDTFTLVGNYQGAWPVDQSGGVGPPRALIFGQLDTLKISEEAQSNLRANALMRPDFADFPFGLTIDELRELSSR